jgi:hypothetical protein
VKPGMSLCQALVEPDVPHAWRMSQAIEHLMQAEHLVLLTGDDKSSGHCTRRLPQ